MSQFGWSIPDRLARNDGGDYRPRWENGGVAFPDCQQRVVSGHSRTSVYGQKPTFVLASLDQHSVGIPPRASGYEHHLAPVTSS